MYCYRMAKYEDSFSQPSRSPKNVLVLAMSFTGKAKWKGVVIISKQ